MLYSATTWDPAVPSTSARPTPAELPWYRTAGVLSDKEIFDCHDMELELEQYFRLEAEHRPVKRPRLQGPPTSSELKEVSNCVRDLEAHFKRRSSKRRQLPTRKEMDEVAACVRDLEVHLQEEEVYGEAPGPQSPSPASLNGLSPSIPPLTTSQEEQVEAMRQDLVDSLEELHHFDLLLLPTAAPSTWDSDERPIPTDVFSLRQTIVVTSSSDLHDKADVDEATIYHAVEVEYFAEVCTELEGLLAVEWWVLQEWRAPDFPGFRLPLPPTRDFEDHVCLLKRDLRRQQDEVILGAFSKMINPRKPIRIE